LRYYKVLHSLGAVPDKELSVWAFEIKWAKSCSTVFEAQIRQELEYSSVLWPEAREEESGVEEREETKEEDRGEQEEE
jgi:hypothetical protein